MAPVINPNFDQVTAVSAGVHQARITGSELKKSQKNGDGFVRWEWTVYASDDSKAVGAKVFDTMMYEGPGAASSKRYARTLTGEEVFPEGFNTEDWHGREATITTAPQTDRPEFMQITSITPAIQ